MNFQFYREKLEDSEKYKDFVKKNPSAYPCSCLFILDREHKGEGNKVHFDFWLPEEKKMNSFRVDGDVQLLPVESFDTRDFEKISFEHEFNMEDFEEMILKKLGEEKINGNIQKLLFSLQRLDGKDFLITTGFLNSLGLIKLTISIDENKIIDFKKMSFFDMMKIVKGNRGGKEKK